MGQDGGAPLTTGVPEATLSRKFFEWVKAGGVF